MKSGRLDSLMNVALAVAAATIASHTVLQIWQRVAADTVADPKDAPAANTRQTVRDSTGPVTPAAGETFPTLAGVNYAATDRTVLLFLKSGCVFCTESMSFYRRLMESTSSHRVRVVGISKEPEETIARYLTSHGFRPHNVISTSQVLGVRGTPTLIVVDQGGRVEWTAAGKLSPEREETLIRLLTQSY